MHDDVVSSPLLWPDTCPSLQGDVQRPRVGITLDMSHSASPSGPCLGRKHPIMLGPHQDRPSRVSGPVSQAPRPHGSGFPDSFLGAAPYETVPLVDEVPGYSPLLAVTPTKNEC